ncbi:hypothetical protein CLAIMM_15215 [Cladophialophora immunda]|nr:hypothetical protein CLAIMM_15215 [Cladophialophora immunda]
MDLAKISTAEEFKSIDRLIFQKLLNEDRCVRQITSHFLDNVDIVNCTSYNARSASKIKPCYICLREQSVFERQANREEDSTRATNIGLAQFEETIEDFALSPCFFCLFLGNIDEIDAHSFLKCPHAGAPSFYRARGVTKTLQNRLSTLNSRLSAGQGLVRGSCCYQCLLPSRVCARLKDLEEKEATDGCVYPLTVKTFIAIIELRLEIGHVRVFLDALGVDLSGLRTGSLDFAGILDYFRRPTRLLGTDAIQVCRVLNDLSVVKIVQAREKIEGENDRKRYRVST